MSKCDDKCGCPPPVVIPSTNVGPEGPQGIQGIAGNDGIDGTDGTDGANGANGTDGTDGLFGRGIAVFVQNTEPNQTDFNTDYGTIDGFGVNGIPGSNMIQPGDIWIEICP